MQYYVYILASYNHTLYIGVTNNLIRRIFEHKQKIIQGFSQKYNTVKLVYFEACTDVREAITREKRLKKWNREWKLRLIKTVNPDFRDLYDQIIS